MREIPLTQGKVTLVDDEDYEALIAFKWRTWSNRRGAWYAISSLQRPKRTTLLMHAYIMGTVGMGHRITVDHIDNDGLNNQRSNLRQANMHQQNCNKRKCHGTSSSFKGVSWHKIRRKWQANIQFEGRLMYLGLFDSEVDAAHAYDLAAEIYFGPFAKTNLGDLSAVQIAAR